MLELRGLSAGYGGATVLRDIDLAVAPGEMVALVGANGAGKSTLLKTISGLVRVGAGDLRFEGAALDAVPAARRPLLGIAHVPEGRDVFATMTVEENLRLGAYGVRARSSAADVERRLAENLDRFPVLRERLRQPAGGMSGGQQQMLAIARGLMAAPKLFLLDEPSLGLAPLLVEDVFRIVADVRRLGVAVLIAEQNARMSLAIADRGYVLENGRIVAAGTGAELLANPATIERYLGVGTSVTAAGRAATSALTERLSAVLDRP